MRGFRRRFVGVFLIAIVALSFPSLVAAQDGPVVEEIIVQGNRRIEASTVLAYLPLRVGEPYDQEKANEALKVLFRTNLFSDIKIERRGRTIVVTVSENPIIREVAFEGNGAIQDDALTPLINLPSRSVYSRSKVLLAAQLITQQYHRQGYYAMNIEPQIIELDQYRVNVIFKIDEGRKSFVDGIYFLGNEAFSDSDLRGAIVTTIYQWWKFLSVTDTYDPDRLEFDKQLLRAFYTRRGYADFSVEAQLAERSEGQDGFIITFVVNEGPIYRFGKDKFNIEVPDLKEDVFSALPVYQEGARYDAFKVGRSLDAINEAAQDLGYAFIDVSPDLERDREKGIVTIVWSIAEAPRTYIERIDINGNSHTEDRVIRREFRLREGDVFNQALVARTERAIRGLNFFNGVKIDSRQGSAPDKVVLDAQIVERPTGEISLGVGYSSVDEFIGDFAIRENNFQGRGQVLEVAFGYGTLRRTTQFRFIEPYFFGRRLRFAWDISYLFRDLQRTQGYEFERVGSSLSLRFPLREDAYLTLQYQLENDTISNSSSIAEGDRLESIIGYIISYDRRDDVQQPSDGWLVRFGQDFAGVGGEARFVRTSFDLRSYLTLSNTAAGRYVFASRLLVGHIRALGGSDLFSSDRFFLGAGNFRGFDRAGVGPRNVGVGGNALGARLYGIWSNELRISSQILRQVGLTPILFTDVGIIGDSGLADNLVDNSGNPIIVQDDFGVRMSVGFSLLWESPLGPLRFDFSDVLLKENYDREDNFHFQIGVAF